MIELKLNGVSLELTNDTYKEAYSNIDNTQLSEGGSTLRSVTRLGILTLSVAYQCDGAEKAKLDNFNKAPMLTATLFDEGSMMPKTWPCYMEGYNASLKFENNNERFYKVSFNLKDLSTN